MEIKTEADDIDEGSSPADTRPLSSVMDISKQRWNSPRIRKKLRAAMSFNKSISN
jgi:transient receptor potential cation channel subfamily A protein 1